MRADPKYSAGARLERKAIITHVRHLLSIFGRRRPEGKVLVTLEGWILLRQRRYDKRPGGLGK